MKVRLNQSPAAAAFVPASRVVRRSIRRYLTKVRDGTRRDGAEGVKNRVLRQRRRGRLLHSKLPRVLVAAAIVSSTPAFAFCNGPDEEMDSASGFCFNKTTGEHYNRQGETYDSIAAPEDGTQDGSTLDAVFDMPLSDYVHTFYDEVLEAMERLLDWLSSDDENGDGEDDEQGD